jgi:hypothetical protein
MRADGSREEILREWRGCDEAPDLNAGPPAPTEFISAILRSAGLEDGINEDRSAPPGRNSPGTSSPATPSRSRSVKSGHLVLRVTQPAMRFHLEQMKPMLLARIREHLGENRIKSVKFTLG